MRHRCAGSVPLIETLLTSLSSRLIDSSPVVRRLCLLGLGHISQLAHPGVSDLILRGRGGVGCRIYWGGIGKQVGEGEVRTIFCPRLFVTLATIEEESVIFAGVPAGIDIHARD